MKSTKKILATVTALVTVASYGVVPASAQRVIEYQKNGKTSVSCQGDSSDGYGDYLGKIVTDSYGNRVLGDKLDGGYSSVHYGTGKGFTLTSNQVKRLKAKLKPVKRFTATASGQRLVLKWTNNSVADGYFISEKINGKWKRIANVGCYVRAWETDFTSTKKRTFKIVPYIRNHDWAKDKVRFFIAKPKVVSAKIKSSKYLKQRLATKSEQDYIKSVRWEYIRREIMGTGESTAEKKAELRDVKNSKGFTQMYLKQSRVIFNPEGSTRKAKHQHVRNQLTSWIAKNDSKAIIYDNANEAFYQNGKKLSSIPEGIRTVYFLYAPTRTNYIYGCPGGDGDFYNDCESYESTASWKSFVRGSVGSDRVIGSYIDAKANKKSRAFTPYRKFSRYARWYSEVVKIDLPRDLPTDARHLGIELQVGMQLDCYHKGLPAIYRDIIYGSTIGVGYEYAFSDEARKIYYK